MVAALKNRKNSRSCDIVFSIGDILETKVTVTPHIQYGSVNQFLSVRCKVFHR